MFQRGALDLLTCYGDDSSEDEVPAARVSTKRVHSSCDPENAENRKKKLPLPDMLKKPTRDVHVDDPDTHMGRTRSFIHEDGNWATYVYVPLADEARRAVDELAEQLGGIGLHKVDHYHVSLTRTVVLRYHWINPFVESVRKRIHSMNRFVVMFDSLGVYCNEERSRTFVGLRIRSGYDSLSRLVEALDVCLGEFNLPRFFKDPSFHVSVLWCLGDKERELNSLLPQLTKQFAKLCETCGDNLYTLVDRVQCKSGNKLFDIAFE